MGNFDTSLLQIVKVEIYFSCQIWRQSLYFQSDPASINTNGGNQKAWAEVCMSDIPPPRSYMAGCFTTNHKQSTPEPYGARLCLFFYHKWFFCLSWLARHASGSKNACPSCMRPLGSISNTTGKKKQLWCLALFNLKLFVCFKVSDINAQWSPPKNQAQL